MLFRNKYRRRGESPVIDVIFYVNLGITILLALWWNFVMITFKTSTALMTVPASIIITGVVLTFRPNFGRLTKWDVVVKWVTLIPLMLTAIILGLVLTRSYTESTPELVGPVEGLMVGQTIWVWMMVIGLIIVSIKGRK